MLKHAHSLSKNKFVRGGIIVTTTSFLANVLNYFFQSLLGHTLGSSGFGEIAALFSYIALISVPLSVITTIIIQKVSSSKDSIAYAHELESFFVDKLRKWWFLLVIPFLAIPFIPRLTNLSVVTSYMLVPFLIISLVSIFHTSALQGLALFFEFSIVNLLATVFKLMGPLLVLFHVGGLPTVLLFILLSALFSLIAQVSIFRKYVAKHALESKNMHIEKRLISFLSNKQFAITLFSLLSIVALNNIDIILVKKFFSSTDAGLYAAWSLFGKIIFYLFSPVASVSFVFFAKNHGKRAQNAMLLFFMCMLVITISAYLGYHYLGRIFIPLFFGNQFIAVIPHLGLASLFGSLYTVIFFINNYFLAKVSKFALILPLSIPLYVAAIYFSQHTIESIFLIDVYFVTGLTVLYSGAYALKIRREA